MNRAYQTVKECAGEGKKTWIYHGVDRVECPTTPYYKVARCNVDVMLINVVSFCITKK